ncbi:Protein of unknown function [Arenibacter nanhaiticus]|uniref:DUF2911 domain-containing protein n=1 Tax=Arenibacter nanhaiticus TaxID=558155 RepID=A0A1M6BCI9_9FLAO|nr:DUF2911 domain-containing protein [Arenibacter nanhaiticus]SHI46397.1 Protein of unknown function [Arenibacter nanhaiticus]
MKILKWIIGILVILLLAFFLGGKSYLKEQTKKNSPERTSTYKQQGVDLKVRYSSTSKMGRVIFVELLPYDMVWRTGANEPTSFTTAADIKVNEKDLAAGSYSLWTIPGENSWKIPFNSKIPDWGVTIFSGGQKTTRNPATDLLQLTLSAETISEPVENLSMDFEDNGLLFFNIIWDQTKVSVPINPYI